MAGKTEHLKPHEVEALGLEHKGHDCYSLGRNKRRLLYAMRGHSPRVIEEAIKQNISPMKVVLHGDGYGEEVERESTQDLSSPSLPSAWCVEKARLLTEKEFCEKYGLDYTRVKSCRLITHNAGHMTYNIAFVNDEIEQSFDYIDAMEKAMGEIRQAKKVKHKKGKCGVDVLTDLHFGAKVQDLQNTKDFSPAILAKMLNEAAYELQEFSFGKVHVHLLGDLIESFTGLNHINVWKNMAYGHYGAKVIRMFVEMFKNNYLDLIPNLGSIKIVAGNHDRVTSSNHEDTDGDAAYLIAYCLELLGYDVEFAPDVLSHEVDGINYILNHGHHYLTKALSTEEICWRYGQKDRFNFVQEGHLHSRIRKMTTKQVANFKLITDDSIDTRRQTFASMFTGNPYSEYGGWSTLGGHTICRAKNKNMPQVLDMPL